MSAPVIIVGAGQAGITLARELRKLAPSQAIMLITADDGSFYSKPSLSNALAANKSADQLVLTAGPILAEQNNYTLLAHTRVTAIQPAQQTLQTSSGETLSYQALVLATGALPISPPLNGDGADAVLSVNSLDDYRRFRAALQPGMHVAVLGGGLIGCEFANDLVKSGHTAEVFDLGPRPLGRLLPEGAGNYLQTTLEQAGLQFHMTTRIDEVVRTGLRFQLKSAEGKTYSADLVLRAIGLAPDLRLAQASGLNTQRGIVVDRLLSTSAPGIYALGDCAEVSGLVLPFILPLMQCARALAKTLAGTPTEVTYPAMPVVVKTPGCPTVVSPPAVNASGAWEETAIEGGWQALFKDAEGKLLGFALLGTATQQRQALTGQLPATL